MTLKWPWRSFNTLLANISQYINILSSFHHKSHPDIVWKFFEVIERSVRSFTWWFRLVTVYSYTFLVIISLNLLYSRFRVLFSLLLLLVWTIFHMVQSIVFGVILIIIIIIIIIIISLNHMNIWFRVLFSLLLLFFPFFPHVFKLSGMSPIP